MTVRYMQTEVTVHAEMMDMEKTVIVHLEVVDTKFLIRSLMVQPVIDLHSILTETEFAILVKNTPQ